MSKVEKFSRIIIKRSSLSGVTATIPLTGPGGIEDHTLLPAWNNSDIYAGEFFLNGQDEKLWIRVNSTTIRRIAFYDELSSGITSGTSGTSGINGSSGSSGKDGSSGSGSTISFVNNSGLEYVSPSTARTIYNTAIDPLSISPNTVGGITAGTTAGSLTGKTMVEIIDDLLFPIVLPTYTIPEIVISSPIGLIQEVGSIISPVLTLDGIKNDAGAFTLLNILRGASTILANPSPTITSAPNIVNQFGYTNINNPNYKYSSIYTDSNFTIPITTSTNPSSTVYHGNGSYNIGLTKKTNKGVFDVRPFLIRSSSNPQASATGFNSNNITINGWYPYFYGKSPTSVSAANVVSIIQSGIANKVVNNASDTITNIIYNAHGEWLWFAIFSPFPNKTIWSEVNQPLNNGKIGLVIGGPNPDLFSAPTILPVNSPDGNWNGINYKIYVAQKVTTIGICQVSVI